MTATLPTITLPQSLLEEIDEAAAETELSREDLLRAAVRAFLDQERQWREVQDEVAERARAAGLSSEDDVETLLEQTED
jgi:metal-responsive CopG/Arc/MetJ family transcriptional regulator